MTQTEKRNQSNVADLNLSEAGKASVLERKAQLASQGLPEVMALETAFAEWAQPRGGLAEIQPGTCSCSCPFDIFGNPVAEACLPTPAQVLAERVIEGKVWACHDRPWRACAGFARACAQHGITATGQLHGEIGDIHPAEIDPDWIGQSTLDLPENGWEIVAESALKDSPRLAARMLGSRPRATHAMIIHPGGKSIYRRA